MTDPCDILSNRKKIESIVLGVNHLQQGFALGLRRELRLVSLAKTAAWNQMRSDEISLERDKNNITISVVKVNNLRVSIMLSALWGLF